MQFPIEIRLRRSFSLRCFLTGIHALGAVGIFALPTNGSTLFLFVLLGLSLWGALRPQKIIGLCISRHGLACSWSTGQHIPAEVLSDSSVYSRWIVLRLLFPESAKTSTLTLFPDQMSPEDFRRLKVWLRWNGLFKDKSDPTF